MTCMKTGADVYIASHNAVLHGDLFKVDGVWILHSGKIPMQYNIDDEAMVDLCIWSDRYEVISYHTTVATVDQCSEFEYTGKPIWEWKERA